MWYIYLGNYMNYRYTSTDYNPEMDFENHVGKENYVSNRPAMCAK